MVNKLALKGAIYANGDTQTSLASALGMERSSLSIKINGHTEFKPSEIENICIRYKLSPAQMCDIFYPEISQNQ